ncbi:hypothetical protein NMY22_g12021 [Coprinellus aureogranulatus]|nr:hypothetical protein NMY22_g12021 [Coprinellus aureogranulatus]
MDVTMNGLQPKLNDEQLRNIVQGPGDVEWRYEMRRECQEILPGLFLGPFVASKSLDTLQGLGITHIVCIRDAKEAFSVKPRFPGTFQYLTLDVEDNEEQNLIRLFPNARRFITEAIAGAFALRSPTRLSRWNQLVTLLRGHVRHAALPAIMGGCATPSAEQALLHLSQRRLFDSDQGAEYEAIYKANIAVAQYPQTQRQVSRRKRSDEDDDEEEVRLEDRKRPLVKAESEDMIDPNAMET